MNKWKFFCVLHTKFIFNYGIIRYEYYFTHFSVACGCIYVLYHWQTVKNWLNWKIDVFLLRAGSLFDNVVIGELSKILCHMFIESPSLPFSIIYTIKRFFRVLRVPKTYKRKLCFHFPKTKAKRLKKCVYFEKIKMNDWSAFWRLHEN